jgi:hypothetical protein
MPNAKIATKHAKFALEQLHAELAGKIGENKREAKRLAQDMVHVEAVLKILVPGYDVRPIAIRRRKPNIRGSSVGPSYGTPWTCCARHSGQ